MGLQTYRKKRRFDVTSEPRGVQKRRKGNSFVIQKHAARQLHYDFRLELDGVMKSWAVTRGPSLITGEKRLAVHVEDHPMEYNEFEGTIPQGQYGGGTVMIWDRGTWDPEFDPHHGLEKGHLSFTLHGEKLHGKWHLVRMHPRGGEKRENWLLIKADDEAARSAGDPDILEQEPLSVATGRSISEIAEGVGQKRVWQSNRSVKDNVKAGATKANGKAAAPQNSPRPPRRTPHAKKGRSKAKKSLAKKARGKPKGHSAQLPDFVPPSLATLRTQPPSGAGWVHEIKFDGYRIQARLDNGEVRLLTRKGLDWVDKFPNIAAAVAELPAETALIDGEIVVEENGVANFSALQAALSEGVDDRYIYYVFDLLHLDGRDLSGLPLIERKAELHRLIDSAGATDPIRYSEHFEAEGALVLSQACKMSLEGIVSKRADAPHRAGRCDTFIKTKCSNAQELVVGGYVPSTVLPRAIGALSVGYYNDGKFTYAGRVGTGYTRAVAQDLWKRLHPLEIDKPAFDVIPREAQRLRDTHWVDPKMVIETNLGGWTADGHVRQAAFKGVREDKPPQEVVREMPAEVKEETSPQSGSKAMKIAANSREVAAKKSRSPVRGATGKAAAAKSNPNKESDIRMTHPDRVYWDDVGVTKKDLADFYTAVWDWMAPHLVGRPLSLLRCPEGTKGECFFQKHASAGLAEANLRTVIDEKKRQIIAIEDLDGLLSLVQAGVLEVHVRGSMLDRLDLCDRIVFDLDPGEGVTWSAIVAAARDVHDRLAAIDLESFVKLSGGKGVHVVVPVQPTDWDTTKTFVQAFSMAMAADDPDRYVARMTKSIRGGKIFVDYLRNSLEQTSVAAFSTRAREGAPVSVPVTWQELGRTTAANQFTVLNLMKRLRGLKQDPWKDIGRLKQKPPNLAKRK